jgi:hypothetical protein
VVELLERRQRHDVDACTSINEHMSDRRSVQVSLDEERLHECAQIFWLLKNSKFHTQRQLCDIFRWHTEFYWDREDDVDIHRDRLLSLPFILLTRVASTRVWVVVTRLCVAVSLLRVAVTRLPVSIT